MEYLPKKRYNNYMGNYHNKTWRIILRYGVHYLLLLASSVLMALSLHIFTLPARFAPGGVSGIASIMQALTGFPAGFSLLLFNIPLLVLAFFFLKKRLALETLFATVASSAFTELFRLVRLYEFYGDPLLAAIAGGITMGVSIGILIKIGASSGGADIVGLLIRKKHTSLSISWLIFSINAAITFLAGILYLTVDKMDATAAVSIVLFSFISLFMDSRSMEVILNGFNSAVKFEIITEKAEELSKRIIGELARGVTIIKSRGAFTNAENNIVVCVVRKRQISQFQKLLKAVDSQAFAIAMNTREVLGNGFNS